MEKHKLSQYWVGLGVAVLVGLIFAGCSGLQASITEVPEPETAQEFAPVISATGKVVPQQWANLSMPTAGVLAEILVAAGETVEAGQELIRLAGGSSEDPAPELEAARQAAALEVENAQQSLDALVEAAQAAQAAAQQAWVAAAVQISELEQQMEDLEVPDEQKDLTPEEAYDQAHRNYLDAVDAFEPYRDEPSSDETRQERLDTLDQAREDYAIAVSRLRLWMGLDTAQTALEDNRQDAALYADGPLVEDLALAQSRLEAAQAALEAAQAAMDSQTLRAPFAGTVTEIYARHGEWVSPGLPVLALADLSRLRVETTDLNEIDMAQVQIGDAVKVYFDALPEVIADGRVVYISPQPEAGAGVNYTTVIELAQIPEGLRWGMSAFVDISLER
ncbi:MAG TPA: efflux RND transporter periplasmic adaptor subunit [Anaerolineales bacterium]|nr:efflux RND transporter periplasmic adaptor subunit [Anaerolineales bacterium]